MSRYSFRLFPGFTDADDDDDDDDDGGVAAGSGEGLFFNNKDDEEEEDGIEVVHPILELKKVRT